MANPWYIREDTAQGIYYWTNHGYWTQDITRAARLTKREATATANRLRRQGFNAKIVN